MPSAATSGLDSLPPAASAAGRRGWAALPAAYAFPESAPSLAEAQEYCRRLARNHYENFSVATRFLPARLHQHFFNLYAYCRISDDLGDEVGNPEDALRLLDEWEEDLRACYGALRAIPCSSPCARRCAPATSRSSPSPTC